MLDAGTVAPAAVVGDNVCLDVLGVRCQIGTGKLDGVLHAVVDIG
jgi:hypothetical protein